jgi:hypothetical protein
VVKPNLVKRGPMRRRLRILRRRREAMLLDLGALVLEMHRHGRFLPDSLQRRAAEAVGTDAELRALSRSLEAGDGDPDLVAAGVAGNCERCGALHTIGAAFCSQCGKELPRGVLPRKAALGSDPELAGGAPMPRRTVVAAPAAAAALSSNGPEDGGDGGEGETAEATQVLEPEPSAPETPDEPGAQEIQPAAANGGGAPPPPISRRARATRVRQRLDEPARPTQALPTGLLAGIAAGLIVIVVGILVLSSGGGGDDEPDRAAQVPAQNEPEPPPPDEVPSPSGTPPDEATSPATALEPVEDVTASDYDPSGDDEEHGEEAQLAVDGDATTSWPTEEYDTGSLQKDGVGLALAPAEAVPARGLDLETTTPGFDMTIYGAEDLEAPTSIDSGWTQIASEDAVGRKGRIDLDTAGRDFSHYLIWITTVPDDENKVEIVEAQLLR